jgi:hypothetical protein
MSNAKVGKEDTLEPTTGNESLHEIGNDDEVKIVNFATSKNQTAESTESPHCNIHKFDWTSADGENHNQIDHILIDRRWYSNILDSRTFKGADCDTAHYLLVARVRMRLAISRS